MLSTTQSARRIRCRRVYLTAAIGTVAPERVRVVRRADGLPDGWWIVRFLSDGAMLATHEERLGAEFAP